MHSHGAKVQHLNMADMSLKLSLPEGGPGFRSAFFVSTVSDSTEATCRNTRGQ